MSLLLTPVGGVSTWPRSALEEFPANLGKRNESALLVGAGSLLDPMPTFLGLQTMYQRIRFCFISGNPFPPLRPWASAKSIEHYALAGVAGVHNRFVSCDELR